MTEGPQEVKDMCKNAKVSAATLYNINIILYIENIARKKIQE